MKKTLILLLKIYAIGIALGFFWGLIDNNFDTKEALVHTGAMIKALIFMTIFLGSILIGSKVYRILKNK